LSCSGIVMHNYKRLSELTEKEHAEKA